MGRWAQRSRSGGGILLINYMQKANLLAADSLRVTFASGATAIGFEIGQFETLPGGMSSQVYAQVSANVVDITFDNDVDEQVTLVWSGSRTGFVPNQQILIN